MKGLFRKVCEKADRAVIAASFAVGTLCSKVPVLADIGDYDFGTSDSYGEVTGDTIVDGVKTFFGKVGFWGGILWAIVAIYTLVLAVRNEDNEGRNKAILNLVAAIALIATGTIINITLGQE